ncbi:MAG TPA: hypothetical protein VFL14_15435, partial [Xanthomonadales bacterium]|nr:hypothetical protein [Xanthomonadales bacterium]
TPTFAGQQHGGTDDPEIEMRKLAFLLCLATTTAVAAEPAAPDYSALGFLVGHCWKGTFPDGKATDEHCFAWLYGRQFIRDVHKVRDESGKVVYEGETTYAWDARKQVVAWRYISAEGLVMDGTVAREGADLVFPATYAAPDGVHEMRAVWTPTANGYRTRNSEKGADGWKEHFGVEFTRVD